MDMDRELQKRNDTPKAAACCKERTALYPGIELCYWKSKSRSLSLPHPLPPHRMEIFHCRAGRLGWKIENRNPVFLGPGDFSLGIVRPGETSLLCFPAKICEGLTLSIDLQTFDACPPGLLAGTGLSKELFEKKYRKDQAFRAFSGSAQTDAIFSWFYEQPESIKLAYQKLKAIELLLYLSKMENGQKDGFIQYQDEQVTIVKKIHGHLTEHIGERITIEELSRQYPINPTALKSVFKSVYGNSLAAHMREHRMELSAKLLQETNLSIAEIGQKVGYESQGKFTAAFKAYYQMLPTEYRKRQTPSAGKNRS